VWRLTEQTGVWPKEATIENRITYSPIHIEHREVRSPRSRAL
jgi:hypothetical protein